MGKFITTVPKDAATIENYRRLATKDFKWFIQNVFYFGSEEYAEKLGRFHDYMIDFLRLHELNNPDVLAHSDMTKYLPTWNAEKKAFEGTRWIYWPVWDEPPTVEDGDGEIAKMFHGEEFWRGRILRVNGNCRDKCLLVPRGHIKTTIGTEAHSLWLACRDPKQSGIIRSEISTLATKVLGAIKRHFHSNKLFEALFGHYGNKKGHIWNERAVQFKVDDYSQKDYTIEAAGLTSEVTGSHYDWAKLDDLTGEQNVITPDQRQKVFSSVEHLDAVMSPGSFVDNIGTIWHEGDHHSMYIRPDGCNYEDCSFLVCTVTDEKDRAAWPEGFPAEEIQRKYRKSKHNLYFFYCQYFQQPSAKATTTFKPEWIRHYKEKPEDLAREKHLDIVITADCALTAKKTSDYTVALVQGQTPDRMYRFVLDGLRDKMPDEQVPKAIMDLAEKWLTIARQAGTTFKFGVEADVFQVLMKRNIDTERRRRGLFFKVEELKTRQKNKQDRIRQLAAPYSTGSILWPEVLMRYSEFDRKEYDFIKAMREEYLSFPRAKNDDIMDAQAHGEDLLKPLHYPSVQGEEEEKIVPKDAYSREESLKRYEESLKRNNNQGPKTGVYSRSRRRNGRVSRYPRKRSRR